MTGRTFINVESGGIMSDNLVFSCFNSGDINGYLPYFQMLFDRNKIGVMITDAEGVLVYFNDAQEQIDELARENVLGRKLYDVYNFTPENSPGMTVLRTGKPVIAGCHYYRTRHGKMVNASCDIYPLHSENGGLLGVICYVQGYSSLLTHVNHIQTYLPDEKQDGAENEAALQGGHYSFNSLVGADQALKEAASTARRAARSISPVMLIGETGVGKEIFAQAIHYESERHSHPYTAINCSAVPETLLEGILFGTTKGAFTGATNKAGLFEVSDKGTLFLDELDSMPIGLQSKLLRVLQERKVRRVGEVREREINLKIISSVRSDPLELIDKGVLRADFYYRLGVVKIQIPSLRQRKGDIMLLVSHFLKKHSQSLGISQPVPEDSLVNTLCDHNWPGNVRELEHAVEAMLNIAGGSSRLNLSHLARACPELAREEWSELEDKRPAARPAKKVFSSESLAEAQKSSELEAISAALKTVSGNRSLAARLLGVSPQALHYKIKKYKLRVADYIPVGL